MRHKLLLLGTIPTELANIKKFATINGQMDNQPPELLLDGNQLTGTMPYLGSVTQFDVSRNPSLQGTFPSEYESWTAPSDQVVRIDISETGITGSLETIFCSRFDTLGHSEAEIVVDL